MALPTPTVTVQDGAGNTAVALAANATAFVTAGGAVSIALQSTTGVVQAEWSLLVNGLPIPTLQGYRWTPATTPAGFTITLPPQPMNLTLLTAVTDGNNTTYCTNQLISQPADTVQPTLLARGVSAANNESLTAFVGVTGGTPRDGITYIQGDTILLAGQTAKAQNGLYQVGLVTAGTAPLTRMPEFATGVSIDKGEVPVFELGPEGTLFGNTLWKTNLAATLIVDTTAFDLFPRQVTQSVTLVAGTVTVTNVPILSATKSNFLASRTTANTSTATTGGYHPVGAVTPGIVGTASLVFDATVAAGTINAADISTLSLTIINF